MALSANRVLLEFKFILIKSVLLDFERNVFACNALGNCTLIERVFIYLSLRMQSIIVPKIKRSSIMFGKISISLFIYFKKAENFNFVTLGMTFAGSQNNFTCWTYDGIPDGLSRKVPILFSSPFYLPVQ